MKINTIDRFGSLVLDNKKFMHNQSNVSNKCEYFSSPELFFLAKYADSETCGIQKKEHRISSHGIMVDYNYIGQYK